MERGPGCPAASAARSGQPRHCPPVGWLASCCSSSVWFP